LSDGDATMKKTFHFEWFCCFREGIIHVKSDEHPEYPSTSRHDELMVQVHDLAQNDKIMTIHEMVRGWGLLQLMADHLGNKHISTKFIPWHTGGERKLLLCGF
jgi:hypothetical protein